MWGTQSYSLSLVRCWRLAVVNIPVWQRVGYWGALPGSRGKVLQQISRRKGHNCEWLILLPTGHVASPTLYTGRYCHLSYTGRELSVLLGTKAELSRMHPAPLMPSPLVDVNSSWSRAGICASYH